MVLNILKTIFEIFVNLFGEVKINYRRVAINSILNYHLTKPAPGTNRALVFHILAKLDNQRV